MKKALTNVLSLILSCYIIAVVMFLAWSESTPDVGGIDAFEKEQAMPHTASKS